MASSSSICSVSALALAALAFGAANSVATRALLQRLAGDGVEAVGTTPEQFGADLKQEIAKWGKVVKASGAKAD